VANFRYLGTTTTDQNLIHEKIMRLNSSNACYHSVQNLLSSRLLSINVKIKIRKNLIFPVVLYECETWSLALTDEHGPGAFANRVLRISGPKRNELIGGWTEMHNEDLQSLYC
jgi:hypothetical protein